MNYIELILNLRHLECARNKNVNINLLENMYQEDMTDMFREDTPDVFLFIWCKYCMTK